MTNKRPKIKYAPRHWHGVLPAFFVLFATVTVGAVLYSLPSVYGFVAYNNMFSYLTNVANAQEVYHDKHDAYTTDTNALVTDHRQRVKPGFGMSGRIIAACDDGWVAYAQASYGKQALYASSLNTLPQPLTSLQVPSCITAEELNGTTLDYKVAVSKVTVTRAAKLGDSIQGAAQPTKAREAARVTWAATNSCSKGQTPTYRVRLLRQDLMNKSIPAALKTPRDYTTTKLQLDVSNVLNGMTYKVQVSGKCGTNYPYNDAVTATYAQKLPTSNGVVGRWNSGRLVAEWGKVATSGYVHYQLQVQKYGTGAWRTIGYDMDPTKVTSYKFSGYTASYGDRYRIRAFTTDREVKSAWSSASTVRFTSTL